MNKRWCSRLRWHWTAARCECGAGQDWETAWSSINFHSLIMYKKEARSKFIEKVKYFILYKITEFGRTALPFHKYTSSNLL